MALDGPFLMVAFTFLTNTLFLTFVTTVRTAGPFASSGECLETLEGHSRWQRFTTLEIPGSLMLFMGLSMVDVKKTRVWISSTQIF